MKKFVRPFLIVTLCLNSFSAMSLVPNSASNINNIKLVYANNNSQVKLNNNQVISFSSSLETRAYSGGILLEQDLRKKENSSNNTSYDLVYNLDIVEVPNNTTLSFDASSDIYLQQVTSKEENLIFWSDKVEDFIKELELENLDFKAGDLISQEDNSYYFGLYNWLLEDDEKSKEDIANKYNLDNLDDVFITQDWFETKKDIKSFNFNEVNFSAVYNNLFEAYSPKSEGNKISITLPDGTYYIYNTPNKLETQENKYLDDKGTSYSEIDYNWKDIKDLQENALILIVGNGANTPVSIEKVASLNISEKDTSSNTLSGTATEITEAGSDDLDLVEFVELGIVELDNKKEEPKEDEKEEEKIVNSSTPTEPINSDLEIPMIVGDLELLGFEEEDDEKSKEKEEDEEEEEEEEEESKEEDEEEDDEDDEDKSKDKDDEDDDEDDEDEDDGKTVKTNSSGVKLVTEKDGSYTYKINDDTMDEADFKLIDFGDDITYNTSTTTMPLLDLTTVYDSSNQPKNNTITQAVTRLINTQAVSQAEIIEDLLIEEEQVTKVVTTHVYMRDGANSDYSSIRVLAPGQQVVILEVYDNGWNKVSYNGQVGYVFGQYLRQI